MTMRCHIRHYCYECRRQNRRTGSWSHQHRWEWEYHIECDCHRLISRQGFGDYDRAIASAQRSWAKLAQLSCLTG